MSILMKKPRIEEIADALGDAKKTLLGVLDGPGEYARFDLEKGPLPVGGAPLVRRSILSYKGREYPGVYLRTTLGSHFIEVSGKSECATYEVDEANRSLRKVDEPLSAEELRRVLGWGSGGGSELPDGYAVDGSGNVTIAGALKANNNGDVEVLKNLKADGNILSGIIGNATLPIKQGDETMLTVDCWVGQGAKTDGEAYSRFYFAVVPLTSESGLEVASVCPICTFYASENDYDLCSTMDDVIGKGFLPVDLMFSFSLASSKKLDQIYGELQEKVNDARYMHGVTIKLDSTGNSVLAFTAMSRNDLQIKTIENIGAVFPGCRLACSGGDKTGVSYVYLDVFGSDYHVGYLDSTGFKTDKILQSMVGAGLTIEDRVLKMG